MTSDKERVLMSIICETNSPWNKPRMTKDGGWPIMMRHNAPAPQFVSLKAAKVIGMPLSPGDIVRCETNPHHAWGISEFVEILSVTGGAFGSAECILREIGSDRLLKMSNESFSVLRFMPLRLLYTGKKHQLYNWGYKAFWEKGNHNPDADYYKRCGGIEFNGDTMIIWSRPHIWRQEKKGENGATLYAQPKRFELKWDKNTRLKDIVTAMQEQGFAEDYEYGPEKPVQGMGGCATFTRESLESALDVTLQERQ